jgi:RecJ-like exonuclease
MWQAAKSAAALVRVHRSHTVRIVTHIDADALSAAGIAASCLQRAGIDYRVTYCKSLDNATLTRIREDRAELSWFTDLGSAVHEQLGDGDKIITDHHEVHQVADSLSFPHVNPHVQGIAQDDSISGAGCAYLVATAFESKNADLAATAIVGALGDLQDMRNGRLVGLNRKILADGEAHGVVRAQEDIRFFGRSTRPLPKFLRYADPEIPSVRDSDEAAIEFLVNHRIRVRDGGRWRTWMDLAVDERDRILRAVEGELTAKNSSILKVRGETYDLIRETEPELRCAKEFATLLNSTARYDRPEVGLALAMGVRTVMGEARKLLTGHRRSIGDGLQMANRIGLTPMGRIAYYDAGAEIRDTILGIITGILLGGGKGGPGRVVVGLTSNGDGGLKVSARSPDELVQHGVDLSLALKAAAESVGGNGGGHAGAAGATIPPGTQLDFLKRLSSGIDAQVARRPLESKTTSL